MTEVLDVETATWLSELLSGVFRVYAVVAASLAAIMLFEALTYVHALEAGRRVPFLLLALTVFLWPLLMPIILTANYRLNRRKAKRNKTNPKL